MICDNDIRTRRIIITAITIFLLLLFFVVVYNYKTSDNPQVFEDIIEEITSRQGSNKTAERNLFYILSLTGSILSAAAYFFLNKISRKGELNKEANDKENNIPVILICVLAGMDFFIYSNVSWILISSMIVCIVYLLRDRAIMNAGLCFYLETVYAICAVYRLYVLFGGRKNINTTIVGLASLIISLMVLLVFGILKKALIRGILIVQIFIPFLLLVFLTSHYRYEGADIVIQVPFRLRLFVYLLIFLFVCESAAIY